MSIREGLLTIVLAIISSSALTAYINNKFAEKRYLREKDNGMHDGVRLLLYDRIKYLAKSYISRDAISSEDLEDLERMWECYHGPLEGNGYLDKLMAAVHKLPIKR